MRYLLCLTFVWTMCLVGCESTPSGASVDAGSDGVSGNGECISACGDRECGADGCGGDCGSCSTGETCRNDGVCTTAASGCTPSCLRHHCGDDGCGGQCGTCIGADTCVEAPGWDNIHITTEQCEPPTYPTSASCPPPDAERGTDPGDVVPNAQLFDCAGNAVNLRGLCTERVSIVYQINVDCAPCIDYVNTELLNLKAEFGDQVDIYVVFDGASECSTQAFFTRPEDLHFVVQGYFALTFVFGTGGKDSTLVMYEGNRIVSYSKKPTEAELRAAILAAP